MSSSKGNYEAKDSNSSVALNVMLPLSSASASEYLIKCGGQAYQPDIVTESWLSKSKISSVLSRMKKEGRIIKIKNGKENIIRLVK